MPNFLTRSLWLMGFLSRMSSDGRSQHGNTTNMIRYGKPQIASKYDEFYSKPVYQYENQIAKEILEPYGYRSAILDLGAGTGLVRELTDPVGYFAVDNSNEMLRVLTTKHPTTFTILADLTSPEGLKHLEETATYVGPFDLVTTLWAGHSFHSQELFNLIYSMLVPNGTIIFHGNFPRRRFREEVGEDFDMNNEIDMTFNPTTLHQYLRIAGFKDTRIRGFNAVPDWLSNRLPQSLAKTLIRSTQHIPARYHFNGAAIGRKPYGN